MEPDSFTKAHAGAILHRRTTKTRICLPCVSGSCWVCACTAASVACAAGSTATTVPSRELLGAAGRSWEVGYQVDVVHGRLVAGGDVGGRRLSCESTPVTVRELTSSDLFLAVGWV